MNSNKPDNFNDRLANAANARKAMLEKFKARPGPDDPAVIARIAEQKAIAEARAVRQAERRVAREVEATRIAAEKAAQAVADEARAAEARTLAVQETARAAALAAQQKAARDARYAARNARRK